jgi:hypothetical protein
VPFPIPEAQWALPGFPLTVAGLDLGGMWLQVRMGDAADLAHLQPDRATVMRARANGLSRQLGALMLV